MYLCALSLFFCVLCFSYVCFFALESLCTGVCVRVLCACLCACFVFLSVCLCLSVLIVCGYVYLRYVDFCVGRYTFICSYVCICVCLCVFVCVSVLVLFMCVTVLLDRFLCV